MPLRLSERLRATSLRTQLTLWNTAIVLLMTTATLLAVRLAARAAFYADADAELRAASREVAFAVRDLEPDVAAIVAEMRRKATSHEERGWFMHLLTEEGDTVWKSDQCPDVVTEFPPARLDRDENVVQVGGFRYVRRRIPRDAAPAFHVRVGTSTTMLDEGLARLLRILLVVGAALTMLTPLAGWWLAVRATRPLASILRTAKRLKPTHLGDRLHVRGTGDELDQLSHTINGLLDSVASHVDRQEQFVADAAHELRGPLAALQSSLEVAIAREPAASGREEMLTDILEAARHLSKITNDLLLLAESGGDGRAAALATVDIGSVARQVVAMFAGAAEEKGVSLSFSGTNAFVPGDPSGIRRLVSNLLDNAIRFTPAGGRVAVRVEGPPHVGAVVLTVGDTGVGIAAHDLPHVFDRFFKSDASRSHAGPTRSGGLGLPICRAIVESCGGTIRITSRLGEGTTATVRFPSAPQSPQSPGAPQPDAIALAPPAAAGGDPGRW